MFGLPHNKKSDSRTSYTQKYLPFPAFSPAFGLSDFLVTDSNRLAWQWLAGKSPDDWPFGGTSGVCILIAPPSGGKTHLSSIWLKRYGKSGKVISLPDDKVSDFDPLTALSDASAFLLDNADFTRESGAQVWLFHLINQARENKIPLLLTARLPPIEWGISLPDLLSRLKGAMTVNIDNPDDCLIRGLFLKHCRDYQIRPDEAVIEWIIARIPRTAIAVRDVVSNIYHTATNDNCAITMPWLLRKKELILPE